MILRRIAHFLVPEVFDQLDTLQKERVELTKLSQENAVALKKTENELLKTKHDYEHEMLSLVYSHEKEKIKWDQKTQKYLDFLWNRLSRKEQDVVACLIRNKNQHMTAKEMFDKININSLYQVEEVTNDLSNMGLLNICKHENDDSFCFTIKDEDLKSFVYEKVKRFDENRKKRKKGKKDIKNETLSDMTEPGNVSPEIIELVDWML